MNKILIVGGAGYIGGYLTDVLLKSGFFKPTVYDSLLYETRFLKEVDFIRGDIRDTNKLRPLLEEYPIIVWLAAMVGDGACQVNQQVTKEINEDSVKWLADNYKGKIIFTSTCSVYGVNNEFIDEYAPTNPLSTYAETKLEAERYLLKKARDPLIFRLGTLYGQGDTYSRVRLDLVANILSKRAADGEVLKVFGGEQWRPLLHVKDVAHAVEYGLANNINGLFNLGEDNFTIRNIAEKIIEIIPSAKVEYKDIPFEDKRNYRVNCSAYRSFGWSPRFKLTDGIKEIYTLVKENRLVNPNDPVYSNAVYVKINENDIKYGPST